MQPTPPPTPANANANAKPRAATTFKYIRNKDLLETRADVRVNPVNTELDRDGYPVMGAGLALQFKGFYPELVAMPRLTYMTLVAGDTNPTTPGDVVSKRVAQDAAWFTAVSNRKTGHLDVVANLPTKRKWREPSKLEYVEKALNELVEFLNNNRYLRTVAIPPLGCGQGGLSWPDVRLLIEKVMRNWDGVVIVYEPPTRHKRVMLIGSRDWTDTAIIDAEIKTLSPDTIIVHGDCELGADSIANGIALFWGYKVETHPALWDRYGNPKAVHIRNQEMVDSGLDSAIAFWLDKSPGTGDAIERLERAAIPVKVITAV